MSQPSGRRFTWLINRRVGASLLWAALVIGVAVAVNLAGIHLVGGMENWQRWLRERSGVFRVWRIGLYAITAWGWWWMRQRVLLREPTRETRWRFLRIEVAAVAALAIMEGCAWLHN